ncbi:MAG: hypothetical protein ACFFE8_07090 [Candidatus Heimdallarchaeota archaeon]
MKFAEGFSVSGIFLKTPEEIFPIYQENTGLILVLKRNPDRLTNEGVTQLVFEGQEVGILVEKLEADAQLILLTDARNVHELSAHWKRFSPHIIKTFDINSFVKGESIEIRLVSKLEDIRVALTESYSILKEKLNLVSK